MLPSKIIQPRRPLRTALLGVAALAVLVALTTPLMEPPLRAPYLLSGLLYGCFLSFWSVGVMLLRSPLQRRLFPILLIGSWLAVLLCLADLIGLGSMCLAGLTALVLLSGWGWWLHLASLRRRPPPQ
jgi:hypothetical protein